ncbi:glycoside hydrolase family 30 protein [Solitalea canadensis]|uniref:O-glycosyl hydrolase n=1 Tax=Solitalea canadensis (strain ATCC 29591 / DSM 3403 / JCM 21819 / LMG 8368 / NBRC 15130 / NCIMB 12057 / USAM 9D) TaxID=929556 RepID=H8KQ12_SOLCM|nr:glycoside hydrolase family 30 beta sandwich domain-containing protein [Solitalea canadensis]AFD06180.1 O-glycosyl hydrolase [Solitalea canadensis DSM 3403]
MKVIIKACLATAVLTSVATLGFSQKKGIESWITSPEKSILFEKQKENVSFGKNTNDYPTIDVNAKQTYQSMDGFGYTLTGGSAGHFLKMSQSARTALLKELFGTDGHNIGTSFLRVSIGASDLNEKVFSYNDLAAGETDPAMKKFDLGQDKKDVIPVLKEILAINPKIKILGSPWSPPTWMKTNNDTRGGSLKPEWYQAYALYLVKYVQAMKTEGINIYAITVQNEPLHPGNNPSLLMLAPDQAIFVKTALGPAFEKAGIKTKIILYDHNCDRPDYPISIMNDPEAKKYVDGSAFHLYGGKIDALTEVHNAHPDKNLYFTEQWVGAPGNLKEELDFHIKDMIIGAPRNWSRTVLEWNISNNPQNTPYTDRGGCDRCLGAVTIDNDKVTRNPAYYTIAHAAKFVRPGSVRIASNTSEELPNVTYKTPSGKYVVIAYNNKSEAQTFNIRFNNQIATLTLDGKAAATYVW